MLGLVRLTAHFSKIIYLLAFDRAKVERALDQDGLEGGRNYLDKIVELSFDLPATSPHALGNLLIEGLDQAISGIQTGPFDPGRWQDVAARVLGPLLSTPRDINRYLAALPASLRMIGEEVGEICTRGYLVMPGYLGDPDATRAAIDPDGWLHTGDLGSMDDRGYCRIEGRIKEMIIRGGENIYPREIETVLLSHPAITGAAVVGIPDRFWGEIVGPAVSTSSSAPPTEGELAGFCRARLASYKIPARWLITSALPLTATGKIRKNVLSAQLAEATTPVSTPKRGTTRRAG